MAKILIENVRDKQQFLHEGIALRKLDKFALKAQLNSLINGVLNAETLSAAKRAAHINKKGKIYAIDVNGNDYILKYGTEVDTF